MKDPGFNPNILFICMDQETGHPESSGNFSLPNRERLKSDALSFDQFQVSTTFCTSSRSVIYTGQHAPLTGMWDNFNFAWIGDMNASIPTVGHMLRDLGYYTAYKGRWILSDLPENASGNALEKYGFSDYQEDGDLWGMAQEGFRRDPFVADSASEWLTLKSRQVVKSQPWFLAVNFVNPHDITFFDTDGEGGAHGPGALANTGAPDNAIYRQEWDPVLPESFQDTLIDQPEGVMAYGGFISGKHGFIPRDRADLWQTHLNYYLNCLRDSDRQLGTVLDALEESGQREETVIILTSDHGEMGSAHGLRQSGGVAFREVVNVPLVVRHPIFLNGGSTQALGSAIDIAPTLLAFAGLSRSEREEKWPQLKGHDLSTIVADPSNPGPRGSSTKPGSGVLYTYDMIHSLDVQWFLRHASEVSDLRYALGRPLKESKEADLSAIELPDLTKRRMFRGIFDGRYKYVRYFAPARYNQPETLEEVKQDNDLALYDLIEDPGEVHNLANPRVEGYDETVLLEMNRKLNHLITTELEVDRPLHDLIISRNNK